MINIHALTQRPISLIAVEVRIWMDNYTPPSGKNIVTYPCQDLDRVHQIYVGKGAQGETGWNAIAIRRISR